MSNINHTSNLLKICSLCSEQKSIELFPKTGARCKVCNGLYRKNRFKNYYEKNKEKLLAYDKEYRKENKKKIFEYDKEYRNSENFKEKCKIRRQKYYIENKEQIIIKTKDYYKNNKVKKKSYDQNHYKKNKEKISKKHSETYQVNKEQIQKIQKTYRENNKERVLERARQIRKFRMVNDSFYAAARKIRALVETAFKRIKLNKPANTETLLRCSLEKAKAHIESQFQEGMSWKNHSHQGWHIDHIRPISSFNLEELHLANHYTNLQPLWAKDNLEKGDKY